MSRKYVLYGFILLICEYFLGPKNSSWGSESPGGSSTKAMLMPMAMIPKNIFAKTRPSSNLGSAGSTREGGGGPHRGYMAIPYGKFASRFRKGALRGRQGGQKPP